MSCSLVITLAASLVVGYFVSVATGGQAKILLESVDNKTVYKLNKDILEKISQLEGPIRVIAAVGNARVGKSTTLNLISHIWNGKNEHSSAVEEIFKTGHSHVAVTRNVWAHIIKLKDEKGNIVLLDVEGTDLGDDRVTDGLSMFTAMMSSALNVFALNIVGNGDIGFLYRITRLCDLVFKYENILPNFPKLRIVLRSDLDPPSDEEIRNEIFERARQKAQIIQKYFPRDTIEVTHIPTVNGRRLLRDLKNLSKSDWGAFQNLSRNLQNSQEKKSFKGSLIDGATLKQLAEKLVEVMNSTDSWKDFGDFYTLVERDICSRSYEKHIKPVLRQTSKEIGDNMIRAINEFKKVCVLEEEISNAEEKLKIALKTKRESEDEEKRRQDEEKRRKDEEKRRQEEQERRRAEVENRRRQEEENSYWETLKTGAKYFGTLLLGGYLFSDPNLKYNVTILPHSEYNDIGLRGVCWKWNEDAKKSFGLTGDGCGVIAQEVRMLYPWAVSQEKDGYLRVQYDMLREMIRRRADPLLR